MAQSQIQLNITSVGEGEHTEGTVANTVEYYKCRRGRAHRWHSRKYSSILQVWERESTRMAQSQIQLNITSVGEGEHTEGTVANTVEYYKCRRGRANRWHSRQYSSILQVCERESTRMAQSQIQLNITSVGEGEHTDGTVANTVEYYKCRRGRAHR